MYYRSQLWFYLHFRNDEWTWASVIINSWCLFHFLNIFSGSFVEMSSHSFNPLFLKYIHGSQLAVTEYLRYTTYKEDKFILAHGFWNSVSGHLALLLLGQKAGIHSREWVGEEAHMTACGKQREWRGQGSNVPSRSWSRSCEVTSLPPTWPHLVKVLLW